MRNRTIDVHCHFFNISFAFAEMLEIGWRWIHSDYPYTSDERGLLKGVGIIPPELKKVARYVASYFASAVRTPGEHYTYEQGCCQQSQWHVAQPLITVPLMMDIFFLFDKGEMEQRRGVMPSLHGGAGKDALNATTISEENADAFDAFAQIMKTAFIPVYKKRASTKEFASAFSAKKMTDIGCDLDQVIAEFKVGHAKEGVRSVAQRSVKRSVQMTRGYSKHLEELQELQRDNPETVLPFLAVDPRRIGIEELVREQVVDGAFKGVKLYPPLGYLPTHPNLYPIYRLCVKHNIPVTVHTSKGGLLSLCDTIKTRSQKRDGTVVPVTFDKKLGKTADLFFANPAGWLEILENSEFSGLHLNFAHFGGEEHIGNLANQKPGEPDHPENWTGQIIGLMERFRNVYADFAYCPNNGMLDNIMKIAKRYPVVQQRLMFGTDYNMVMKESVLVDDLKNYFDSYTGIFPEMLTVNPAAFLG